MTEPQPQDNSDRTLRAAVKFIFSDLLVRGARPVVIIGFAAFFIKEFMPTESIVAWLALVLSIFGLWYVMGQAKTWLDKTLTVDRK